MTLKEYAAVVEEKLNSLLPEENQDQVEDFLKRHAEFEPDTDDRWLPDALKPFFSEGMIQLLAHRDRGMDGFFIARLRRKR